jgi:hypothetical protein
MMPTVVRLGGMDERVQVMKQLVVVGRRRLKGRTLFLTADGQMRDLLRRGFGLGISAKEMCDALDRQIGEARAYQIRDRRK